MRTVVTQYTITGTTLTFTSGNEPATGDQISVSYSNMTLTRVSAGIYEVTFNVAQPNAEYAVSVTNVQSNGQTTASAYSLTLTGFFIRTSTVAAPTVLSDNGDFINFIVVR